MYVVGGFDGSMRRMQNRAANQPCRIEPLISPQKSSHSYVFGFNLQRPWRHHPTRPGVSVYRPRGKWRWGPFAPRASASMRCRTVPGHTKTRQADSPEKRKDIRRWAANQGLDFGHRRLSGSILALKKRSDRRLHGPEIGGPSRSGGGPSRRPHSLDDRRFEGPFPHLQHR